MNIISRAESGLRPPKYVNKGRLVAESTAHWNGPTIKISGSTIWDHSRCAGIIRGIQNYHMDAKGWSDIAYNFIACPHGYIFECRGLNVINGANGTNSGNRSSHAIMCLAGEENPFTDKEKLKFRECIMYIANSTGAPEGCKGHRDHKSTACPGDARYSWVRQGMPVGTTTWPPPPPPEPITSREEDFMNEPLEIVKGTGSAWFVTDGITKQWVMHRTHAAILCLNRGAKAAVLPANMTTEELAKMAPHEWPQAAIDSIRLVGPTPPQ